ncbi:MAG: imidazole glycerol phosphate synthase cyclase subunit [Alphaproteobacteria bacterium]
MLKTRIMPTLLYRDLGLVKGEGFDPWRRVGGAMQAIKVYNMRDVDELVFMDITATKDDRPPDFDLIDDLADECFMPLTVGGGVRHEDDVRGLLKVGADKVALNTAMVSDPELVGRCAQRFGSQCIVASIDARLEEDGSYQVYTHSGTQPAGIDPVTLARQAAEMGAGEILLTSIDRDGRMCGYDVALTMAVSRAVTIPVVASGGCGDYRHMAEVLSDGGASAVAAASIFHFTEKTPAEAKQYLKSQGFPVRQ